MAINRYTQMMVVSTQASLPTSAQVGDFAYCLDVAIAFFFDGTNWQPSNKVVVKKSTVSLNAKNTGTTLLYTLEASTLNFFPTQIVARATGVGISGVVTAPTLSIGSNSTSYNNIATTGLMATLLSALGAGTSVPTNVSNSPALAGGTAIYANVSIGAIATNYTELFDILGFYDS